MPINLPPEWHGDPIPPSDTVHRGDPGYEDVEWDYREIWIWKNGEFYPLPRIQADEYDEMSVLDHYPDGTTQRYKMIRRRSPTDIYPPSAEFPKAESD